jgi:DNA-binding NarL/FixJ family response regulator
LGAAIDRQLGEWQLTRTERETALAILKGLSHKTIARWSGRSERTVRQHAVAVYRKSGLDGRAELSAFFLEGLLLPQAEQGSESPPLASP